LPRRKIPDPPLTALELEIMKILWDTGPANVQTVQAKLEGGALAYTTVQTMLNVLHRKGRIERQMKDRAYMYKPVLSRQTAASHAVREMLERFFGGSADNLVLNLVETRQLSAEKLAELQKIVEKEGTDESE
jgi:predicted transcriptional regulator